MQLAVLRDRATADPLAGMDRKDGQMSPRLDELSLKFAIFASRCERPSLDIGCGDGVATAALLERGARVVAVDPDEEATQRLLARVPHEQHPRVSVRTAQLPAVDFMVTPFAAVHVSRVLQELDGLAIRCSFRKFFRWLYPDGKLFLSAFTPHGFAWRRLRAEFIRRHTAGAPWPGYFGTRGQAVHLLDERTLRRELEDAGFQIEEAGCYTLPWDSNQVCCGVVARI